jgi:hypothetical protein
MYYYRIQGLGPLISKTNPPTSTGRPAEKKGDKNRRHFILTQLQSIGEQLKKEKMFVKVQGKVRSQALLVLKLFLSCSILDL